jgi:hypothetical protein
MLLNDGSWVCDFCGDLTPKAKNEHVNCVGMLKFLLFEFLGHTGYTQEKRVHVVAECLTRNYIQGGEFTYRLTDVNRMQWAVAYDTAVDWIVRDGGYAVLARVTRERLTGQPGPVGMRAEAIRLEDRAERLGMLSDPKTVSLATESRPPRTLDVWAGRPDPWEE